MTKFERTTQIWSALAFAARNRQTLTYEMLARLTGTPSALLDELLAPIHSYCQAQSFPPLTSLVVDGTTGMPGNGYTAGTDVPRLHQLVFSFEWIDFVSPAPEQLEAAGQSQLTIGEGETSLNGTGYHGITGLEGRAGRGDIRRFFGAISLGHPRGLDNEQIDADLAKEYGDTHENE